MSPKPLPTASWPIGIRSYAGVVVSVVTPVVAISNDMKAWNSKVMLFKPESSKNQATVHAEIAELKAKLAAIDRSQMVIEFDLDGIILSANVNFQQTFGYREEEIVGKHHRLLVPDAYRHSAVYADFWRRLNAGEFIADKFMRLARGGEEVWIEAAYNPIFDQSGNPYKVIKYAVDISAAMMHAADNAGQIAAIGRSQAVISFDLDGIILSANENFLTAMGYCADEIVGRHHSLFVPPGFERSIEYRSFWDDLRRGKFIVAEFKRIGKGGREVWIQASYNPIFDPGGRPVKIVKFATDITQAKVKSADDAGQLDAISKSQGVISFSIDGVVLSANENFLAMMGYDADEVIGRHHSRFVDAAFAASPAYADFWATLRSGRYHSGEFQRIAKNGKEVWLQASYNPIFDLDGRLSKVVKYAIDITKAVEQRKQFNLLSLVANETDNSVVITDHEQKIIYVNGGFERLTGYRMGEVIGRVPGHILQGPKTDKETLARVQQKLAAGEPLYEEILNYGRNGNSYWVSLAINPVRGKDGRIERFISVQANITKTKEIALEFLNQESLARKRAESSWEMAQAADKAKSEFLANMSHELRTPLNGILGMTSVLAQTRLAPAQVEMVEVIQASSKTLQFLLSDVLDLAKIEAGQINLLSEPVVPAAVARTLGALFQTICEEKGLGFTLDVDAACEQAVLADSVRITQIVTNLCSNAVKFTDRGSITLTARSMTTGSRRRVTFAVTDTGIGLSAEAQGRLFKRFAQADSSITRRFGGTGLGLSISKQLCELMGGGVDVRSVEARGSTFTAILDLPASQASPGLETPVEPAITAEGHDHAVRPRVLLVEDHPVNRKIVEVMLENVARLDVAVNGADGVRAAGEGAYDVILMDMQMPVMDGLSATRAIRAAERARGGPASPIIMLTANAMAEHINASLEAGADLHLSKPITYQALLTALNVVLNEPIPNTALRRAG